MIRRQLLSVGEKAEPRCNLSLPSGRVATVISSRPQVYVVCRCVKACCSQPSSIFTGEDADIVGRSDETFRVGVQLCCARTSTMADASSFERDV